MASGLWFLLSEESSILSCVNITSECFTEFISFSFSGNVSFHKLSDLYRNCVSGGLMDELDSCFLDLDVFVEGLANSSGSKSAKVKSSWLWK